jgi:hypothetical protein
MATQALELPSSADLMCDNIMCEKVRYLPCVRSLGAELPRDNDGQ